MPPNRDVLNYDQGASNIINPKKWVDISREIHLFLKENATKCPKCGEFIEMFCDNPEFSMQLHYSQVHKQLWVENENSGWNCKKDGDYVCPVCMKSISILNNKVALSVSNHIEKSTCYIHQLSYNVASKGENFLSNIFSSSLKSFTNHKGYFKVSGCNLVCQLCNCDLVINGRNAQSARTVITGHIQNEHHKSQHSAEIQKMANAILCYNKEITLQHQHMTPGHTSGHDVSEESIFSGKLINKNKKLIEKNGLHYFCHLCNRNICYFPNGNTQKLNLIFHLNGETHRKNLFYKRKTYCYLRGLRCDGKVVKENRFGYTHEIYLDTIKMIQDQEKSARARANSYAIKGVTLAGGSGGDGISAPPREAQIIDGTSTSQQIPRGPVDTNKMNYESIRILNQYPQFAPHVHFLNFVDNNFTCTLCDVILTISPSKTHYLEEHILGSRHAKLCNQRNIPVPNLSDAHSGDSDNDSQLIATSPIDQIGKLFSEPEFASHIKYFRLKGNQCRCLLCGVFLTVSIYVNHNLKEHILGSVHAGKFENGHEPVTTDDSGDEDEYTTSDLIDEIDSLALD